MEHNTYLLRTNDDTMVIAHLESENERTLIVNTPMIIMFVERPEEDDDGEVARTVSKFELRKFNVFGNMEDSTEINKEYIVTKYKVSDGVNTFYENYITSLKQLEDKVMALSKYQETLKGIFGDEDNDEENDDEIIPIANNRTLH